MQIDVSNAPFWHKIANPMRLGLGLKKYQIESLPMQFMTVSDTGKHGHN